MKGPIQGPIIIQRCIPVEEEDDEEALAARILVEEHRILTEAVRLFCEERTQRSVGRTGLYPLRSGPGSLGDPRSHFTPLIRNPPATAIGPANQGWVGWDGDRRHRNQGSSHGSGSRSSSNGPGSSSPRTPVWSDRCVDLATEDRHAAEGADPPGPQEEVLPAVLGLSRPGSTVRVRVHRGKVVMTCMRCSGHRRFRLVKGDQVTDKSPMQTLKPTVWIGKKGCTPEAVAEIRRQLEGRKPVKVRFLRGAEMDPGPLRERPAGRSWVSGDGPWSSEEAIGERQAPGHGKYLSLSRGLESPSASGTTFPLTRLIEISLMPRNI